MTDFRKAIPIRVMLTSCGVADGISKNDGLSGIETSSRNPSQPAVVPYPSPMRVRERVKERARRVRREARAAKEREGTPASGHHLASVRGTHAWRMSAKPTW